MPSDSYSYSSSGLAESSEPKGNKETKSPGRIPPKEAVVEKKECCKCPVTNEYFQCQKLLMSHFYSAVTFKNKTAYFMMIGFSAWMILMALTEKNLLFRVILSMGFIKLYSFMVKKF
eukprot:gnl/Chilomastix_caulleri/6374.p1 GENE.gnl/Chilomastix_caulleri/6374~~gnl/Chilomastix_caulleri/6374.p1  ORF type:complete len:117 (-),score=25.37 gnl/Chilomastix_caulleri/6374:47-397(-)